jgi:signal transduction histidine kinase
MSFQRALLLVLAIVLVAALVPAGLLLERRLALAIEEQVRLDLEVAPSVLAESRRQAADAMMMHAKEIASAPGLMEAMMAGDHEVAMRLVEGARGGYGEVAILLTATGESLVGPSPPAVLVDATRDGAMPVEVVADSGRLRTIALAPVSSGGVVAGVAGVAETFGETEARVLAGLARTEVLVLDANGEVMATTMPGADTSSIAAITRTWSTGDRVAALEAGDRHLLLAVAPLGEWASVVFVRDLARDTAILSTLRRIAGLLALLAAAFALALGAVFAMRLTRPVRSLAAAADRLAAGDFHAPIEGSRISEVQRMADAFEAMRRALAARLEDLKAANRELEDRQSRLSALQAELIQRDRLAAAGQLVAQLAHEIRNPVANVRNCLELIRRRLKDDPEAREFTDLAIDELLRMHELAEQMLDLHRPRDADVREAAVDAVAQEVASLVRVGAPESLTIEVDAADGLVAGIAPDSLKQVLLTLLQNARESMHERGTITLRARSGNGSVRIVAEDTGPGIPADVLPRIFDPFFTTKGRVHGVGLGLFVAEGVIRSAGGHLTAANREPASGAVFTITLPAVQRAVSPTSPVRVMT